MQLSEWPWLISVAAAVVVVALAHYLARHMGRKPDKRDHDHGYPPKKGRPWHN
jgi:hypothetical protein